MKWKERQIVSFFLLPFWANTNRENAVLLIAANVMHAESFSKQRSNNFK